MANVTLNPTALRSPGAETDATPAHADHPTESAVVNGCPFCPPDVASRFIRTEGSMAALHDAYPVTPGHFLIVPLRHVCDYFDLDDSERRDLDTLLQALRLEILQGDEEVEGFNVGINCGPVAGQTVAHAHVHLIPRRRGDTPNPRGGVRGVIPTRMNY